MYVTKKGTQNWRAGFESRMHKNNPIKDDDHDEILWKVIDTEKSVLSEILELEYLIMDKAGIPTQASLSEATTEKIHIEQ